MKKSAKGALAASAAVVLLTGGASTLAFWTDEATVNGGSVSTGTLALDAVGCDAAWTYASGSLIGEPVDEIVPGDSITKECTFTVTASGDHLTAEVDAPDTVTYTTSLPAASLSLAVESTFDVGGTTVVDGGTITEANNGQTLTASFVVTFPYGDETTININDTQALTTTLNDLTVTLTQLSTGVNPNA